MAPFSQQFSASASPVLTLVPQAAHHQVTPGLRSFPHQTTSAFSHSASHAQLVTAWPAAYAQTRGRKRSRDEAAINLDSNASSDVPTKPAQNPFRGNLVLPRPNPNISHASFGATPTPEAQVALGQSDAASLKQQDRPSLRSHKSQRLDQDAIAQQQKTSNIILAGQEGSSTSVPEAPVNPIVDDFTLHLGIGWRRISEDIDIQAAARGWARYVENKYPVTSAKICLESKGLQSYLVEAAEGYFLFSENLREGRLVSRSVEGALLNLKGQTPVFEGEKMIAGQATITTSPSAHGAVVGHTDVEMNI